MSSGFVYERMSLYLGRSMVCEAALIALICGRENFFGGIIGLGTKQTLGDIGLVVGLE